MLAKLKSLSTLQALDEDQVAVLRRLEIRNLGDLLSYPPFRHARLVKAAADGLLGEDEIADVLVSEFRGKPARELLSKPTHVIFDVGDSIEAELAKLGLKTIGELASYVAFDEAEELVTRSVPDDADPHAPACVLPTCKKYTRDSKGFVSFVRERELRGLSVHAKGGSLVADRFRFRGEQSSVMHLGYAVAYTQDWIHCGVHLGEPQGSVNLLMGQDTQVSQLDWRRAMRSLRREQSGEHERLFNSLVHQRAVDEVARATAEEHQHGATSAFGANAATAGSFVAAGAVIGGVGGGVSGALAGLVIGNYANVAGAAPTLAGAAIGTAVGSVAGAAAGSLVYSGATTLGFVQSDAAGDRQIVARSAQDIHERTIQNASSLRSFWSNIVSQTLEEEQQDLRTSRVTNHNRIHALNALYFEVLNEYRVSVRVREVVPLLFVPFRPIHFDEKLVARRWWFLRTLLRDQALVKDLDEHFQGLATDPSPMEVEAAPVPPDIESVQAEVQVELNLVEFDLGTIVNFDKRKNITVTILTDVGDVVLETKREPGESSSAIGIYSSSELVQLDAVTDIRIENTNEELGPNKLEFEEVAVKLSLANRATLTAAMPSISTLERKQVLASDQFAIEPKEFKDITWNIAGKLRGVYEGVADDIAAAESSANEEQQTETRLAQLIGLLNANKFGFTRLILEHTEREQLAQVLADVSIGAELLSQVADTTPLGFCGQHVVLPLKRCTHAGSAPAALDTHKLRQALAHFTQPIDDPAAAKEFLEGVRTQLGQLLAQLRQQGGGTNREREIEQGLRRLEELVALAIARPLLTSETRTTGTSRSSAPRPGGWMGSTELRRAAAELLALLQRPLRTDSGESAALCSYHKVLLSDLAAQLGKPLVNAEVSLPSPALFMEPVLSHAKGAERYDMRRNSHYEILPAPGIAAVDPNVLRSRSEALTPTVPSSHLTIQQAPTYPLPEHLATLASEAGELDLSTLLTTNSASLQKSIEVLGNLAKELASASAGLSGDAQKAALQGASDIAKQLGGVVDHALSPATGSASPAPKESAAKSGAPQPKLPEPPKGQQEKAEVARELDRINASDLPESEKHELKQTLGVAPVPPSQLEYKLAAMFLDERGLPFDTGEVAFDLTAFELGSTVALNGGVGLPFAGGQLLLPDEFTLEKGGKATLGVRAKIHGVTVSGLHAFTLPEDPNLLFTCRMASETRTVTATSVKEAVDNAVATSSFGAELGTLLSAYLDLGVELPFKIFGVGASGTGGAGGKAELDLRGEYAASTTTTTGSTTGSTTTTTYEVVLPMNGWIMSLG